MGLLYKYGNRQLITVLVLLTMALANTSIPFTTHISQLFVIEFFYGCTYGAWSSVVNVWIIELWQHRCTQVLFICQLLVGLGSVLGAVLTSQYLTTDKQLLNSDHGLNIGNDVRLAKVYERRTTLEVPFVMTGATHTLCKGNGI